jgi:ABC-type nitrate/sulfonate/bicarbonate transport system substrate-binding protein
MLEEQGFDDDEIVLEHVGSAEERFEAVKAGAVDAIGVLEPYVTLGRYDEELREVYVGPCRAALVARDDHDAETVAAFRRALNRAVADINDDLDRYRDRYVDLLAASAADDDTFDDVDFERLRSEFELRSFLPVRAPDEERIEDTAAWMAEQGYVDDPDAVETGAEGEPARSAPTSSGDD